MLYHDLKKLIYSLSASEKKQLTVSATTIKGSKNYMQLFQLINDHHHLSIEEIKDLYKEKFPSQNFSNDLHYLFKVISDMLVNLRIQQDNWYRQYQHLMKAQLCFERSIPDRANTELKSALELADSQQNQMVIYQALRMTLDQFQKNGFIGIEEQTLVDLQMKAKSALRSLSQIHEHYILNELLGYRINHGLLPLNDKSDKNLTNLLLSEISLISRHNEKFYESKKLHAQFQSFYLIHIGDYKSAIKIFNQQIELMENNKEKLDFPPYDYLFTLEGILNSLRSIGLYREMDFYLNKLDALAVDRYPDHFQRLLNHISLSMNLNRAIQLDLMDEVKALIETRILSETRPLTEITDNKEMEIIFFLGLYNFLQGQYKQARKFIQPFLQLQSPLDRFPIYRAGCLLHLISCYELQDFEFMSYESRNLKRQLKKTAKLYTIEKLVFQVLDTIPHKRGKLWKAKTWKKLHPHLIELKQVKQELEILKYYDFTKWIEKHY